MSLCPGHPSAQARGSLGIAAVLPAAGTLALLQQSSTTASPGDTSWREPIFPQTRGQFTPTISPGPLSSAPGVQQDLVVPQRFVPSTEQCAPGAGQPLASTPHAETIPTRPVPPLAFAELPPALSALPKSPSPLSLPFTGCLNLPYKAAGSKHALKRANLQDVSRRAAKAEPQALGGC